MSGVHVFRGVCRDLSVCPSTWMEKRERSYLAESLSVAGKTWAGPIQGPSPGPLSCARRVNLIPVFTRVSTRVSTVSLMTW